MKQGKVSFCLFLSFFFSDSLCCRPYLHLNGPGPHAFFVIFSSLPLALSFKFIREGGPIFFFSYRCGASRTPSISNRSTCVFFSFLSLSRKEKDIKLYGWPVSRKRNHTLPPPSSNHGLFYSYIIHTLLDKQMNDSTSKPAALLLACLPHQCVWN